jgi:predicted negative regulator of RcsB-dependent stress response
VQARPATRAYVAHKFAQRHWGGVLGVLLTLFVLIGATVITTLQMFEARRQRDFARDALARAEALNEKLSTAERDAREAVALLQQAQPGDFPSSNGRAYLALARVLSAEGRGVEARAAAQRALEQLQKALGPQHPDTRAAEQLSRADSEAPNQ